MPVPVRLLLAPVQQVLVAGQPRVCCWCRIISLLLVATGQYFSGSDEELIALVSQQAVHHPAHAPPAAAAAANHLSSG